MNRSLNTRGQRGYSLAEVLIATAIAAGVLSAVAASLGDASRLAARGAQEAQILAHAKLIATRLEAGMNERQVLAGLPDWRIEREPYFGERGEPHPVFELAVVSHRETDASFEFLARRSEALR